MTLNPIKILRKKKNIRIFGLISKLKNKERIILISLLVKQFMQFIIGYTKV